MIVIVIVCHIQVIINYIQDVNRTTSLFIMLDEFNCMLFLDVKSIGERWRSGDEHCITFKTLSPKTFLVNDDKG